MIPLKDIHKRIEEDNQALICKIEGLVDAAIRQRFDGINPVEVNLLEVADYPLRVPVVLAVQRMYEDGGWATRFDQYDGQDYQGGPMATLSLGPLRARTGEKD